MDLQAPLGPVGVTTSRRPTLYLADPDLMATKGEANTSPSNQVVTQLFIRMIRRIGRLFSHANFRGNLGSGPRFRSSG